MCFCRGRCIATRICVMRNFLAFHHASWNLDDASKLHLCMPPFFNIFPLPLLHHPGFVRRGMRQEIPVMWRVNTTPYTANHQKDVCGRQ